MKGSIGGSSSGDHLNRIAILGNYLPRQCGIATFTTDLLSALCDLNGDCTIDAFAMSDRPDYNYPPEVVSEIDDQFPASFTRAANQINRGAYDVLSIQHEYGIFGGTAGAYLLDSVRAVRLPVVTTLHTVLREPSDAQRRVLDELLRLSDRVVVMSGRAIEFLTEVHAIPATKIDLIPHGIPSLKGSQGDELRARLNITGPMILTFGLLSPDKGLQYMIEALPEIAAKCPGIIYVIVGATHPNVRAFSGEAYRESLKALAEKIGVSSHVLLVDRFVDKSELGEYLSAMDFYVTPYLNKNQITSGTLAYSVGAGKPVISTAYWYAEELLADGRGVLVPFRDSKALATAVLELEHAPEVRREMGLRAAEYGKSMLWPRVASSYLASFARARRERADRTAGLALVAAHSARPSISESEENPGWPQLRLDHLYCLTDDTGILQHATLTTPNRSQGYCVDDNARALIFTALSEGISPLSPSLSLLQSRFLSFVMDALNPATGRFRNFMSYQREWLEDSGSEDSQGRAQWSLGVLARQSRDSARRDLARSLFQAAAPLMVETTSPRTWAYTILGASDYLYAFPRDEPVRRLLGTLAERIWSQFERCSSESWPWLESSLTYANARLPQAMILAGRHLARPEMTERGIHALSWLMNQQRLALPESASPKTNGKLTRLDVFEPIGSNGFFTRDATKSRFDQQPVEAWSTISACLAAAEETQNEHWATEAKRTFGWFLGQNCLHAAIYDPASGGCNDGLHPDRVNRNQGAESTLSFLCALLEMRAQIPRGEWTAKASRSEPNRWVAGGPPIEPR
jgi:glycosyltransferase involved in cell wall biosynthesis